MAEQSTSNVTVGIMPNGTSSSPLVTRSRFWFDDGNIVLQAESTQFKLHRSVLASQSPVFRDIFSIPQPTDSNEATVDGCPVVHLQDSEEDIENLCGLLYDTLRIHTFKKKMELSHIGTMLRLGRKYRFKHFRSEALHLLEHEFPSDLAESDANAADYQYIASTTGILFEVAYLAHENCIKSVLPGVYVLICLNHSPQAMKEGFDLHREKYGHFLRTEEPLSCLLGREHIHRAVSQKTLAWLYDGSIPCSKCVNVAACNLARTNHVLDIMKRSIQSAIRFFADTWLQNKLSAGLCTSCSGVAMYAYNTAREEVWHSLPEYFGLNAPIWDGDDVDDEEEKEDMD
ncbi:unnamed protein product [Cyclocybe aegerita]|uniref:BTB domain-containing protein n=1 Tax=Cyclocybe aegerita TaxID=1973307 RepID=A0A8S0VS67_CYCAE|nr:unnamed protein product [Cyclocybe aegerita]